MKIVYTVDGHTCETKCQYIEDVSVGSVYCKQRCHYFVRDTRCSEEIGIVTCNYEDIVKIGY